MLFRSQQHDEANRELERRWRSYDDMLPNDQFVSIIDINMAGFMIDNIAKGTLKQWHLEDMDKVSKDKSVVLLDVRTVGEFNRGHMDGFRNIPVDELRERINEIEKGKPVYLICQSGLRSYIASRILEGNGYETYNFSGGFRFYDAVVNDRALIERAYACGMDY